MSFGMDSISAAKMSIAPEMATGSWTLTLGFSPRCIRSAPSLSAVLIGCKDGSVWILFHPSCDKEEQKLESLSQHGSEVRSLCIVVPQPADLDECFAGGPSVLLLAGYESGLIRAILLDPSSLQARATLDIDFKNQLSPYKWRISTISSLSSSTIAVSFVGHPAFLLSTRHLLHRLCRAGEPENLSRILFTELEVSGHPSRLEITNLRRVFVGNRHTLAFTEDGKAWEIASEPEKPGFRPVLLDEFWPPAESPGIICDHTTDATDRGADPDPRKTSLVYLSTDLGVYEVDLDSGHPPRPLRISLPGIAGICLALTYAESERHRYLWASDSDRNTHLFWDELASRPRNWRRSGIWKQKPLTALSTSVREENPRTRICLVQARMDDTALQLQIDDRAAPAREQKKSLFSAILCGDLSPEDVLEETASLIEDNPDVPILMACYKTAASTPAYLSYTFTVCTLIELSTRNPSYMEQLVIFLSNPRPKHLDLIFSGICRHSTAENLVDDLEYALSCYVYCLIGTIHRSSLDRRAKEAAFLGCIHLLRLFQQNLEHSRHAPPNELSHVVEGKIRFVRKWGILGHVFAERQQLCRAIERLKPLAALGTPDTGEPQTRSPTPDWLDKNLDLLIYQSQLFFYRCDLDGASAWRPPASSVAAEQPFATAEKPFAWDVRILHTSAQQSFGAVSWSNGEIDIFRIVSGETQAEIKRLSTLNIPGPRAIAPFERPPAAPLHSRALCSVEFHGKKIALLSAPSPPSTPIDDPDTLHFEIYAFEVMEDDAIDSDSMRRRPQKLRIEPGKSNDLAKKREPESVYSILLLGQDDGRAYFLVGLRGVAGVPRLVVLSFDPAAMAAEDDPLAVVWDQPSFFRPVYSLGKSPGKNPIRCLADVCERGPSRLIALGCEDGQVVTVLVDLPGRDRKARARVHQPQAVGRLTASIRAIAARPLEGPGPNIARIYAGTANGNAVAWEVKKPDKSSLTFLPLWGTREFNNQAIARIHLHSAKINRPDTATNSTPLVLVVTQAGRVTIFNDAEGPFAPRNAKDPKRRQASRVPGWRYGRMVLGLDPDPDKPAYSIFASAIFEASSLSGAATSRSDRGGTVPEVPFVKLLTASAKGALRLHSLFLPHYSVERVAFYEGSLLQTWTRICGGQALAGEDLLSDLRRARLTEVAFSASPPVSRLLVRLIFEKKLELEKTAGDYRWLPSHLHGLWLFRRHWDEGQQTSLANHRDLCEHLQRAMTDAWKLEDYWLAAEIVVSICKLTNQWLLGLLEKPKSTGDLAPAAEAYSEILRILAAGIRRWTGGECELKLWAHLASHLPEGAVIHSLARCSPAGGSLSFVNEILHARFLVLHELLFLGPMVALETLRALNLALHLACRKTIDSSSTNLERLRWDAGLSNLYRTLSDFAAQILPTRAGTSDALKHEIMRAFALGLCACPDASIKLAHWLTEANLIKPPSGGEIYESVLKHVDMLEHLEVPVPASAIEAFKVALSFEFEEGLKAARAYLGSNDEESRKSLRQSFGAVNGDILLDYQPLGRLLQWLKDFTDSLRETGFAPQENFADVLRQLEAAPRSPSAFDLSLSFWVESLAETGLSGHLIHAGQLEPETTSAEYHRAASIDPEFVLLSRDISAASTAMLEKLDDAVEKKRIFDPQATVYKRTLWRLHDAAHRFPRSALAQKRIVLGALSHGLLETLDEHVFDLDELALVLDPLTRIRHSADRRQGKKKGVTQPSIFTAAEILADKLFDRARYAERVPKNLRSLRKIISSRDRKSVV